jgi:hypothetical protein
MSNENRKPLRDKIEAAKAREKKREEARPAEGTTDRVTALVRDHPLLLLAGGLVVGVALSTLVPRSPTRKLSKKSLAFLGTAAELGMAYGREAFDVVNEATEDARRDGKARLTKLGNTAKDKAASLGSTAKDKAADKLSTLGGAAKDKAADKLEQITAILRGD